MHCGVLRLDDNPSGYGEGDGGYGGVMFVYISRLSVNVMID